VGGQKKQVCGCEGTVAGMGSHGIAFLCGRVSLYFQSICRKIVLTNFFFIA